MSFPKHIRFVDRNLLETVRNLPCLACASLDPEGAREAVHDNQVRSHPHHLITVAHGGGDVAENVMPLCVKHHTMIHKNGITFMADTFGVILDWLEEAGWVFNQVTWEEPACVYSRKEESCTI